MDSPTDDAKPANGPPPPQQPSPPPAPHSGSPRPPNSEAPATAVQKSVRWRADLTTEVSFIPDDDASVEQPEHNPYVNRSHIETAPPSMSSTKKTMESVKSVLSRWGKKVGETARKAEDLSRNSWQHLKTGPSFAEAAMGRIAQGTKVIAEGGYEKIFRNTFETLPEEQLNKYYACYLSTSAGPVIGTLYLSSAKLAFCSDNPLPYSAGDQTEWSYYKVVIPLLQLSAINPSVSKTKSAEKYIQILSVDKHEFWFMGFVNYDGAVKYLQDTLQRIHEPQP